MSQTISLREWESTEVSLTFDEVDALRRVAGNSLAFAPGSRRDRWVLRATSHVGAIRVGDIAVMIRPKVPLENLFYMLTVGQSDINFGNSLVGYEEHELLPALAAFYERLVADTLNRGVLRSYIEHNETLIALRGRIDIPAMIRAGGLPSPIPCRFDELSIDIPENQILRSAALVLARYPDVAPDTRRNLRRTVGVFDGVADIDPRAIPAINLTRLNRHYEPSLRLAEVVLRSGGVRERTGNLEASTFLIDMNRLFERFVTVKLRQHLAGRLEVRDQVSTHLDVERKIPMRPDLVFYRNGEPVLVADIKYKPTDDGLGRNEDYYQLLAYCRSLGTRAGLLVYSVDGLAALTTSRVVLGGPRLGLFGAGVSGGLLDIELAIGALAAEVRALSGASSSNPSTYQLASTSL